MIRHLIFIGLLFSINHPVIYCQQPAYIIGKVIDSKTTEPVSFATIRLKYSQVGIYTNAEGDFRILNNPGFHSDSLIITCIGFHRFSILIPKIYSLKEVTVNARKRKLNPDIIVARALNIKKTILSLFQLCVLLPGLSERQYQFS